MHLAAIWIYPIKSLDGVSVPAAEITAGGSLRHDRAWMLVDAAGNFVNGKREPRVHGIRSQYDGETKQVTLSAVGITPETIDLIDLPRLADWFSRYFAQPITVQYNPHVGFPDDLESPGPTVISWGSLATMARWFPGVTAEEMRQRLRPNLVLDDCEPFAEDRLFGPPGERLPFGIGNVRFLGNNPCQRCVVPSRDPQTGETTPKFQTDFAKQREETLPAFVSRGRFSHFYRAAVNTVVLDSEAGKILRMGMVVTSARLNVS